MRDACRASDVMHMQVCARPDGPMCRCEVMQLSCESCRCSGCTCSLYVFYFNNMGPTAALTANKLCTAPSHEVLPTQQSLETAYLAVAKLGF